MRKGENLHLKLPQSNNGSSLLVEFYDVSGRLLGQETVNPSNKQATINTSKYNFPAGLILEKITNKKTGKSSTLKEIVR